MLGHPALLPPLIGRDAQRKAFFAQQHVAAVARIAAPDGVVLGELEDVATFFAQFTFSVQPPDKIVAVAQHIKDLLADTGHNGHADDDVDRIGDFNAHFGKRRTDRAHGKRNHIHVPAFHRTAENIGSHGIGLFGRHPVVGRAGVFFPAGADIGAAFNARNVVERRTVVIAAGQFFFAELDELTGLHRLLAQLLELLLAAVDPDNLVGLHQVPRHVDELQDLFIGGQCHGKTSIPIFS